MFYGRIEGLGQAQGWDQSVGYQPSTVATFDSRVFCILETCNLLTLVILQLTHSSFYAFFVALLFFISQPLNNRLPYRLCSELAALLHYDLDVLVWSLVLLVHVSGALIRYLRPDSFKEPQTAVARMLHLSVTGFSFPCEKSNHLSITPSAPRTSSETGKNFKNSLMYLGPNIQREDFPPNAGAWAIVHASPGQKKNRSEGAQVGSSPPLVPMDHGERQRDRMDIGRHMDSELPFLSLKMGRENV